MAYDPDDPKLRSPTLQYRTVTDIQDRTIGEHFLDCVLGFAGSFFLLLILWLTNRWVAVSLIVAWFAFVVYMILKSRRFGFIVGAAGFLGLVGLIWGLCFSRIGG